MHKRPSADKDFQQLVFLPQAIQSSIEPELSCFGDDILQRKIFNWIADAEANTPRLEAWDVWGKRQDHLVTSEGWRNLQDMGIREGIVAIAYENANGRYSRMHQFIKYHMWTGSCAHVICPSAMTDGAAMLLSRHISSEAPQSMDKEVFQTAYRRLTSRNTEEAWTSGQWMTERIGGSDVRNTETLATYSASSDSDVASTGGDGAPLGPWLINGFKWFSSATDANMAILLARMPEGGISAFYAPTRRTVPQSDISDSSNQTTELNGITIQRLKTKLGTRPLPTAELCLTDTRAYLLGTLGQGTKEISTILNVTRVHNAVTACGFWGRGLAISRAFAPARYVRGKSLMDLPAHVRTMAKEHVEYRANMHLTFFVVALLGISEQSASSQASGSPAAAFMPKETAAKLLLRVLTLVMKALTAKAAISGLMECMESLGGVGYIDSISPLDIETNIARLYRDANVLSICGGTTDVMADDTVCVLKGKGGAEVLEALEKWVGTAAERWRNAENADEACSRVLWKFGRRWVANVKNKEAQGLSVQGRELMEGLGWVVCAVLLVEDAASDIDQVACEIARRWIGKQSEGDRMNEERWEKGGEWDRKIVFGGGDLLARL